MGVMGQNILPCIVWKNTKESEHLPRIPKPHLSTSLSCKVIVTYWLTYRMCISMNDSQFSLSKITKRRSRYQFHPSETLFWI